MHTPHSNWCAYIWCHIIIAMVAVLEHSSAQTLQFGVPIYRQISQWKYCSQNFHMPFLIVVITYISYQKYGKCMPTSSLIDINECEIEFDGGSGSGNGSIMSGSGDSLGPCDPNRTCINFFGGFICTCPPGFSSNLDGECIGKSLPYPRQVKFPGLGYM